MRTNLNAFREACATLPNRSAFRRADAGGVGDQAAWVVDAFAVLSGIEAALDEDRRRLGR